MISGINIHTDGNVAVELRKLTTGTYVVGLSEGEWEISLYVQHEEEVQALARNINTLIEQEFGEPYADN